MNENILEAYKNFQIADLDHDLIGICKTLVDWMKILNKEIQTKDFLEIEPPLNYFKMDPHLPRMELRNNVRDALVLAVRYQKKDIDQETKLINIAFVVVAIMYVYHLPVEKLIDLTKLDKEFTRKDAEELLLKDNMSPNWIKEPSNKDFSAVLL